ncbi:MAG: D-alanine--D-alanine ligase [Pseudomonadota bacterium]
MSSRAAPRIAVLMGGPSAEREVSLVTGNGVAAALREEGFEVVEIDAGPDVAARLQDVSPDVAFNALHGRWGEDGAVQGILEWLRIPYTHSGILASSLAMDKRRAKDAFRAAGLPVVEDVETTKAAAQTAHPMAPPYVLKPVSEGSSVGVYIVDEHANGPAKLEPDTPDRLMAEQFVPGRELTASVLGDRVLPVTDIIATSGWYDYHAKYADGGSRHVVPAEVPAEITALCQDYALRAHRALGCRGLSRTDFRWDESNGAAGLFLLETNTQPGMTPTSLSPEQAAHEGMSFGALCRWLVEDASCDR